MPPCVRMAAHRQQLLPLQIAPPSNKQGRDKRFWPLRSAAAHAQVDMATNAVERSLRHRLGAALGMF